MDRAMTTMMGRTGLESIHRFLGQRATRCARGPAPRGIAEMMGVLGMMNGSGGMMNGQNGMITGPAASSMPSGQHDLHHPTASPDGSK